MTSSMPWFRVYSEILDDRKIKRICKTTGHSKALVIGALVCLFSLASESPERGKLKISRAIYYTAEDIADEIGLSLDDTETLLDNFDEMGIITRNVSNEIEIVNWEKRQFKSDNSTERVKEFRVKQLSNVSETTMKRSSNVLETETETETDSETESDRDSARDPFDDMRQLVERMTGYPIPSNQAEILAIGEFVDWGVTETDIQDALSFLSGNGKTIRGASGLRGSVRTSIAKRTQKANAKPAEKPYIPEEHASEVYG